MVFVYDEGTFDAPIDRVWKYVNDDTGRHAHDAIPEMKPVNQQGNVVTFAAKTKGPDGKLHDETWKSTMNPPYGFLFKAVEGPQKGTRHTHTYIPTPDGRTKVIVAGDFHIQGVNDPKQVEKMTLEYLERVFSDDNRNLKTFK